MTPLQMAESIDKKIRLLKQELDEISRHEHTCPPSYEWYPPEVIEKLDELIDACEQALNAFDIDPTPQYLWDNSGGEPPITQAERHAQAHAEHIRLHS